jgi:ubiquitin-protein ligase
MCSNNLIRYELDNIINTISFNNSFNIIECLESDDNIYFITISFNNIILKLTTNLKNYCLLDDDNILKGLKYKLLYSLHFSNDINNNLLNIIKMIDNYKPNKLLFNYIFNDPYHFFNNIETKIKYNLDIINIKIKSKNVSNNNNTNIKIPKELLLNNNQILSLLFNEINKINTNYDYEYYIYPFENNIYDLRFKFNNKLELKFDINPNLYPFYPPKIDVIYPNLQLPLYNAIINLNILKLENWNSTISIEWIGINIFKQIENIIDKWINNDNIDEFDNLLMKFSILSKNYNNDINIDIIIPKNTQKIQNYKKSGIGYGNNKSNDWDITTYIKVKEDEDNQLYYIINEITNKITEKESYIDKLINSNIINYIKENITSIENNHINNLLFVLCSKYKNKLDQEFINYIGNNIKNQINYDNIYKLIKDDIINNENENTNNYETIMKDLQISYTNNITNHLFFDNNLNLFIESKTIKRLMLELSSLNNNLPINFNSSIWIRINKNNINFISFLISGPKDTPYQDGLFEFHVFFPSNYPNKEPKVLLKTTGNNTIRFNPNLYSCGKVCLSLLGTWSGYQGEKWNPKTSTFLQVLISIQSLIFVEDPYFNEPGHESFINTNQGKNKSKEYNENIQMYTMEWALLNQILNPIEEYKDVIIQHFKLKRENIIKTCELWINNTTNTITKNKMQKILNELINQLNKL